MAQVLATDQGWIIRIPDEMAPMMGVPCGSVGVLHPEMGALKVELLPPLEPEMQAQVVEGCAEMREAFEELKRLGDRACSLPQLRRSRADPLHFNGVLR